MTPSFWQVLIILVIILILFGAGKLPKVMGELGKGIKSFKDGMREEENSSNQEDHSSSKTHQIEKK